MNFEIKAFYSKKVLLCFIIYYSFLVVTILTINALIFYFTGDSYLGALTGLSMGALGAGFLILYKYRPTKITIKNHIYYYIVRNVEEVIESLPMQFVKEKKFNGFAWGFKKEYRGDDSVLFIPASPLNMNIYQIFSIIYNMITKLLRYGGITSAVEVKKSGEEVLIYGPYFTLEKIFKEIT